MLTVLLSSKKIFARVENHNYSHFMDGEIEAQWVKAQNFQTWVSKVKQLHSYLGTLKMEKNDFQMCWACKAPKEMHPQFA